MKLLVAFLALLIVGCGAKPDLRSQVPNSIAVAANAALPVLVSAYRADGLDVIRESKDRETALHRLAEVDAGWDPFWRAWADLSKAEDAWARDVESGGDGAASLPAIRDAYCDLVRMWPKSVPVRPIAMVPCGALP